MCISCRNVTGIKTYNAHATEAAALMSLIRKNEIYIMMKKIVLFLSCLGLFCSVNAQSVWNILGSALNNAAHDAPYSRSGIRDAITNNNSCMNGTLSCEKGAIAIFGTNGYYCTMSVPANLSAKLKYINSINGTVNDINITDNGKFVVVWNSNQWYGIMPQGALDKLRALGLSVDLRSVAFDNNGNYVIVTSDNVYSSSGNYERFCKAKKDELGELYSVSMTTSGIVCCYERGATFYGAVPANVVNAMNSCAQTPRFVKFNDRGDYLICASTGYYTFNIQDTNKSQYAATTANYTIPGQQPSNNSGSGTVIISPSISASPQQVSCGICYGTGKCTTCNGTGVSHTGSDHLCGACGGTGKCYTCGGRGWHY